MNSILGVRDQKDLGRMSDRIYSAEQIVVPPALPELLKNFTKEVIRHGPSNIVEFSREYESFR
jgi:hypothetical protein